MVRASPHLSWWDEKPRVTVLGMCCYLPTAVPGLLALWACDFIRVPDVSVPKLCEAL